MNARGPTHGSLTANPLLVGAVLILLGGVALILSYNANRGLPFVPTYRFSVDVPDAAEITKGDDVRISGSRVGQVLGATAMEPSGGRPPFARLQVALDANQPPLPLDSLTRIRPRSVLGSKFLELTRGRSHKVVPPNGVLPLRQALHAVEIDEAFNVFDRETSHGLQGTINGLGNTLAGRGNSLNDAVVSTRRLLPPLQRLLRLLVDPRTDLSGFVRGAAAASHALAPQARALGSLFDHTARTLAAVEAAGGALGQSIDELAPTETVAIRALETTGPVLSDAASIMRALRPAASLLPGTSRNLADAVEVGTPVLGRVPALADQLGGTLGALDRLSRDTSSPRAVQELIQTVTYLKPTLRFLNPAQIDCNVLAVFLRNAQSAVSEGDSAGSWFNFLPIVNANQMLQSNAPSSDLHLNYYPNENGRECEAGNEPYRDGQRIGNPPGAQADSTVHTSAPPKARERARDAGLLEPTPGGNP